MNDRIRGLHLSNMEKREITKEAIQDSLYLLMQKKPLEKITITDIIRRSGVSRSAFYKNFKSIDDIIIDSLDNVIVETTKLLDYTTGYSERLHYMYDVFMENKAKFIMLVNSRYCIEILNRANALTITDSLTSKQRFYTILWNGALYNFFVEWVKKGDYDNLDELIELADEVLMKVNMPMEI